MSMLRRPEPKSKEKLKNPGNRRLDGDTYRSGENRASCRLPISRPLLQRCKSGTNQFKGQRILAEGEQYDTVLLHVGTNNLAFEEPEEVASKMDGLIKDLKDHANKIAISSVIKRYDNRSLSIRPSVLKRA